MGYKRNQRPESKPVHNCLSNYIGLPYKNLFDLIKDDSPANYPDEEQCTYVYEDGHQCITLLNFSSIKAKTDRCELHRNIDLLTDYGDIDGVWRCTIKGYRNKNCGKIAYHRTCIDGVEVIRCNRHLKEHLGH